MNEDFEVSVPPVDTAGGQWLRPQWPQVPGVQALFTTRTGGVGQAPFDSLNVGDHVGDDAHAVSRNRVRLAQVISAQAGRLVEPIFMQQVHGCDVQLLDAQRAHGQAFDACVSTYAGVACTAMVADCLPVLWAHKSGAAVAASHAGWRGLLGEGGRGVLESTWHAYARVLGCKANAQLAADTQVWLGPCIGPAAFEVGAEVRAAFVHSDSAAAACFTAADRDGKWMADLPALARQRLQALDLVEIYGNDSSAAWCTVTQPAQYFSHRRDAALLGSTGRMAACIWRV